MRTTTGTCDPEERIDALATAMELLGEDASDALVAEVADALLRAHERTGMDPDTTVVAFLGATGSGKSSLFNALLGADLAEVGVVRPTTRSALAAVQPGHEATHLLHWIGVGHRVQVPAGAGLPPGVALVDLPDIDSLDVANHALVERLGARVDVLVWVLDPQKYADDIIHTQWIRPLAAHAEVTAAVLTQVDRLPTTERRAVSQDLRRLLAEDGVADPHVLETSAVTGEGIDELRLVIARTAHDVAEKSLRVQGVLDDAVDRVRTEVGGPDLPPFDPRGLSSALVDVAAQASGASRVVDAVGGAHLHRGVKATGWLPLRWLRGLRADPLARLHLGGTPGESRTSLPQPSVAAPAALSGGVRRVVEALGGGRPPGWRRALARVSRSSLEALPARLDGAIARTDLAMAHRPRWWGWADALQWIGWIVAAAGALWVLGVQLAGQFLLVDWPVPAWRGLPVPTWMILLGLLWTLLVVALARVGLHTGARRRRRLARARLDEAVRGVVEEALVAPLVAEDRRQHDVLDALDRATCAPLKRPRRWVGHTGQ